VLKGEDMKDKKLPKKESGFEDLPVEERCLHASHEPPAHMVIPSGKIYRHVCPGCGHEVVLRPRNIHWSASH